MQTKNSSLMNLKSVRTVFLTSLLALLLCSCAKKEEKKAEAIAGRPIKLMTVGSNLTGQVRSLPGTVRATDRVDLAFQVSGPLIELPVREGQRVKRGDLLARIDPRDYETNLRNAKGALARAKAAVDYAVAEYQRFRNVKATDAGAVSDSMVHLKYTAQAVAEAGLQSAEAGLAAAQDQLNYTQLRAPFSGLIARRFVDNYQEVAVKQPILSLQNMTDIEVLVDVPESMMAPIRTTKPRMYADFAADPSRHFELKIKETALLADSLTQTFRVVLVMPAPAGIRILPGMTATVSIEFASVPTVESSIIVPAVAVWADNAGHPMVWVVDTKSMTVHRRAITTGDLTGTDSIKVTEGINPEEIIAISGVSKLQEGQAVREFEQP
ncbi:MAG: efflux RND transporter periplasmic adaptor subunit [Methylococcales bacterium]|nr:efflux RND transporter periplasmic adaptor subunit [Methylococcales bacterium]